jgi:hypothetical protein
MTQETDDDTKSEVSRQDLVQMVTSRDVVPKTTVFGTLFSSPVKMWISRLSTYLPPVPKLHHVIIVSYLDKLHEF